MRLIDADELLSYVDRVKNCGLGKKKSIEYITKYISNMTTAFDVDKDVVQLEALDNAEVDYYSSNDVIDRIDAIDIVKEGGIDVDMCINCTKSKYSNQGRPYCAKEERHLDSFSYKPDWCPLKAGGIDEYYKKTNI